MGHRADRQRVPISREARSPLALSPRVVLPVVVLLSLVLRVAYFVELRDGPCVRMHLNRDTDMYFFDAWARVIADGDWLTDRSLHPWHSWHDVVAKRHLGRDATSEQVRALWERWFGGKRFHQEPFYAYFVAIVYRVLGADPCRVFAVQLALGVVSNVLIYWIARHYFGNAAAAAAGLLAVFCSPLLYYEMKLVRTSLTVLVALALVHLVCRALARQAWARWLIVGAGVGLAMTLRVTFVLFGLGVLAVLCWQTRRRPRELLRQAGATACGLAVGLSPVIARNLAVGVSPLAMASVATVAFVSCNTGDYPPTRGFWMDAGHVARIMGQSDGRFLPAAVATFRTHADLWSYLRLLARKFAVVWHWYEQPNNANFYFFRQQAAALRCAWVTSAVLCPLALVGMALALRRFRALWPLYAMSLCLLAPLLLLCALSRYRMPLLAICVPFAGLTVAQVVEWLVHRRWLAALVTVCAVAMLTLWVSRPLPRDMPMIRTADCLVAFPVYYIPAEQAAREAGDWHRAAKVLDQALRHLPPVVGEMGGARPARSSDEKALATFFAAAYRRHAEVLRRLAQPQAAEAQDRRAAILEAATQPARR